MCQILSITCNNASPNDAMVDALAELVVTFPGASNWTRCFAHNLNLVVKVILCQFDVLKAKANEELDVTLQALVDLAGDIKMKGEAMDDRGDDDNDDREDSWVDPREGMSQDEQDDPDLSMWPVHLVLVKVSSNSDQQVLMNDICTNYKNLPLQSKTPQPYYFLAGSRFCKISWTILTKLILSPFIWCHVMSWCTRIQQTTCSYLLASIAGQSTKLQETGTLENMSSMRMNGSLWISCAIYWR